MARRTSTAWQPDDFKASPHLFERRLRSGQKDREQHEHWWSTVDGLYSDGEVDQWTTTDFSFDMSSGFVVATLDTIIAGVCQPNPKITLTPTVPGQEDFANAADRLVNSYWTRYNFGRQFLMGVFDAESKGLGVWKTLWKREVENVLLPTEQVENLVQETMSAAQNDPDLLVDGRRVRDVSDEEIAARARDKFSKTEIERVVVDRPMMRRVSPWLFFADPMATCEEDLRWCAEGVWMSVENVQKNSSFNRRVRNMVQPTQRTRNYDQDNNINRNTNNNQSGYSDRNSHDGEDQRDVLVWEYWSIEDGVFAMWADGMDEYLLAPTSIPYVFGHPYRFVRLCAPIQNCGSQLLRVVVPANDLATVGYGSLGLRNVLTHIPGDVLTTVDRVNHAVDIQVLVVLSGTEHSVHNTVDACLHDCNDSIVVVEADIASRTR